MVVCEICGKECKGNLGIGRHIFLIHKISPRDYFIKYSLNDVAPVCYCGKNLKFINLTEGFNKFCSIKCSSSHPETRKKYKQTCRKKFGTDNPLQNKEVKEKRKETNKKIYGEEYVFQNVAVISKIQETCFKKFGTKNVFQNKKIKGKIKQTNLKINTENAINVYSKIGFEIISEYKHNRYPTIFKCKSCDFEFEEIPFNLYSRKHKCPVCDPFTKSKLESEIAEEIQNYLFNIFNKKFHVKRNDRTILEGKEIDILIPELNLSIEVSGDYWHSLPGIPENDQKKADTLIEKGFKHFIIKECEWYDNKQVILNKFDSLLQLDFEGYLKNISFFAKIL